jgi:hypothetical protein
MAASDNLHPQQMQLFMTGKELQGAITKSIDRAPMEGMEGLWKSKLRQSRRSGMGHGNDTYQSLQEQGWQGPGPGLLHVRTQGAIPEWNKDELGVDDAHHRIAAAAHMEDVKNTKPGMTKSGQPKAVQRTIYIPTWNRNEFTPEKPPKR